MEIKIGNIEIKGSEEDLVYLNEFFSAAELWYFEHGFDKMARKCSIMWGTLYSALADKISDMRNKEVK